jgi:hypothetical protein
MWGALSDKWTDLLLLAFARAVIFGSLSQETRDHILLSHIRDFPFRRLLRLPGLRWKYFASWSLLASFYIRHAAGIENISLKRFVSRIHGKSLLLVRCHKKVLLKQSLLKQTKFHSLPRWECGYLASGFSGSIA